jgi:hypothetical protein
MRKLLGLPETKIDDYLPEQSPLVTISLEGEAEVSGRIQNAFVVSCNRLKA